MCSDRLQHIKNIALRVIAEDEFPSEEREDVVVPSEETELEMAEKPTPIEQPKWIGQVIEKEETPSGARRRVYQGGNMQVKRCPVCAYINQLYMPVCQNCMAIYEDLTRIVKKNSSKDKPLSKQELLKIFSNLSGTQLGLGFARVASNSPNITKQGGKGPLDIKSPNIEELSKFKTGPKRTFGVSTLFKIWQSNGITPLGPETIVEIDPSKQNKLDKAVYEMNSQRDEHGDLIIDEDTGLPKLEEKHNWYPLTYMLKELSARGAGTDNDIMSMDDFYETILEWNDNHPEKPIDYKPIGSPYQTKKHKDFGEELKNVAPEFQNKTEVGSGGRAVLQESIPDSKSAGYFSVWPMYDHKSPSGKIKAGVATVFSDRIKEVEILRLISKKRKMEKAIENYSEQAEEADKNAEELKSYIKKNKSLRTLDKLRNTEIDELDKPEKHKSHLKKTKKHLEKTHGKTLDEALNEILEYKQESINAGKEQEKLILELAKLIKDSQKPV